MDANKDYYSILDKKVVIDAAYKMTVKRRYHPDKNQNDRNEKYR